MNEIEAYRAFLRWRWPETDGKPICPRCGGRRAYEGKTARRLFHCANSLCRLQFTATSGTIFARRKMTFARLMVAIDCVGRCAALELQRLLGCQYKTAYALTQKIRSGDPLQWVGYWQKPRETNAASGMEARQGGNEVPSRSEDSPTERSEGTPNA